MDVKLKVGARDGRAIDRLGQGHLKDQEVRVGVRAGGAGLGLGNAEDGDHLGVDRIDRHLAGQVSDTGREVATRVARDIRERDGRVEGQAEGTLTAPSYTDVVCCVAAVDRITDTRHRDDARVGSGHREVRRRDPARVNRLAEAYPEQVLHVIDVCLDAGRVGDRSHRRRDGVVVKRDAPDRGLVTRAVDLLEGDRVGALGERQLGVVSLPGRAIQRVVDTRRDPVGHLDVSRRRQLAVGCNPVARESGVREIEIERRVGLVARWPD